MTEGWKKRQSELRGDIAKETGRMEGDALWKRKVPVGDVGNERNILMRFYMRISPLFYKSNKSCQICMWHFLNVRFWSPNEKLPLSFSCRRPNNFEILKVWFFATVLLHFKGGEVKCERGDELRSQHRTAISHNLKYLFLMKYTYFKDCPFGRSNVRFSALLHNRACVLMHL